MNTQMICYVDLVGMDTYPENMKISVKSKKGKIFLMKKSGRSQGNLNFMKNCQGQCKVQEKCNCFSKSLRKMLTSGIKFSFFVNRVICVTFCYTANKLESGEKNKNISSQACIFQ